MRNKLLLFTIFSLMCSSSYAVKTYFLNSIYGQIHQNQSRFSRIISTFECGQPFKVISNDTDTLFTKVSYATYNGYILSSLLSKSKPRDCWQDKYRKFFDYLGMGVTEMHYMGRLQDLLIKGSVMP